MYRRFAFLIALAISVGATTPGFAAEAEDLVTEGLKLRREGKDQQALELFQQAVARTPTPRTLAQLGFCEQALGLWLAAEGHLRGAMEASDDAWIRKNQSVLRESLKAVRARLGSIDLWGTPSGARISLDGQEVATLPPKQPLRVTEGRHVLVVEAPKFVPDRRVVDVVAGSLAREHVALVAENSGAVGEKTETTPRLADASSDTGAADPAIGEGTSGQPDAGASTSPSTSGDLPTWRRVLPWSLLGGAVLAGSIGVWQHLAWRDGTTQFDAIPACGVSAENKGSDARCQGLYDDFSAARSRTVIAYAAGGIFAVGAVAMFVLNASADSTATATRVAVGLGPTATGFSLATTF